MIRHIVLFPARVACVAACAVVVVVAGLLVTAFRQERRDA